MTEPSQALFAFHVRRTGVLGALAIANVSGPMSEGHQVGISGEHMDVRYFLHALHPSLDAAFALTHPPHNAIPAVTYGHFTSAGSTILVASAVGKFAGTPMVTLPVATNSVPRTMSVWNPTQRIESVPPTCPIGV